MKNKGFTLIELIGTVVILAIIALVVLPATLNVMKSSQEEVDKSVIQIVERAADEYVHNNLNDYPKQLETQTEKKDNGTISVQELVNKGYIEQSVYDKHENIHDSCIKITSNSQKYFYEFKKECVDEK